MCGTGGTCRTTCTANADCVAPNVCIGTSCGTGLVAHYRLDETSGTTAADSSGNARNGTLAVAGTGTATFSTTHMVGTGSLNLTSTSNTNGGYVSIPASLNAMGATTTLTIACWVNITTDRAWGRIFDFNNTSTTGYMFLTTFQNVTTPNSVRFAITTTTYSAEQQISSTGRLSTGAWHHIAVVLDAGATYTGTLYIDGAVAGTNTAMTLRPSSIGNTPNNWIGRARHSPPTPISAVWSTTSVSTTARFPPPRSQISFPPFADRGERLHDGKSTSRRRGRVPQLDGRRGLLKGDVRPGCCVEAAPIARPASCIPSDVRPTVSG